MMRMNKEVDFTDPKKRQAFEDEYFTSHENIQNPAGDHLSPTDAEQTVPKKFQYLSWFLALAGVALIITGLVIAFSGVSDSLIKGGAFWVMGILCGVPGVYYSYKIYKSRMSSSEEERLEAASEIPRFDP